MTNLITEARELCEHSEKIVNQLHAERLDYELEYMPLIETIQVTSELCDALEKAEEQNKQLMHEVCRLACESVEREKTLAKLEAEVIAVTEPKRGEWVEAKSGVMSVYPPGQVMCSVCKQRMPSQWKKMPPYCYGCGAKMEDKP